MPSQALFSCIMTPVVWYRITNDDEVIYLETNDRSLSATIVDNARLS